MTKLEHPGSPYKDIEFLDSLEGRTLRILSEYLGPMARLDKAKVNSTVLFLGSARANPSHADTIFTKYYWEAEELAYLLAKWAIPLKPKGKNFVVCTGGGPGIMEAANRGAQRAGGKSIGMNISLPQPQDPNPYITPELSFAFHYFFMRKFWLVYKAKAVVAFPGGFGTLDEFFEIVTLLQTSKISRKEMTLVLYGEDYWKKVVDFDALVKAGAITPEDRKVFLVCSDPKRTFAFLKKKLLACL
ncbi:LOG family protein [bacterium]|nr:MAG: LOG family protein [bacterium]